MLGLFILGLLPYIYVPIAASHNPILNWNNASNLKNFLYLIKRDNYGGFAPEIMRVILDVKSIFIFNYFTVIFANFSYQIIFVSILGLIYLFLKKKLVFLSLLIGFILIGPFFAFYGATYVLTSSGLGVIERFYGTSGIVIMLLVVYGFYYLVYIINSFLRKKIYIHVLILYFLIVPLFLIYYNYPKTEISKSNIGNNLIEDIYFPIAKNSILRVSGDTITFNTWYMRHVLGYRKDVEVVNAVGVGSNYFMDKEVRKYVDKYKKVPLDSLYYNTLEELRKNRRIYLLIGSDYVSPSTILVPKGLIVEVYDTKNVPKEEEYEMEINKIINSYRIPRRDVLAPYNSNLISDEIPTAYSDALIEIGNFITSYYKDPKKATYYYKKALWVDHTYYKAYARLGYNLFIANKECKDSVVYLKHAIEIYPIDKESYKLLLPILNSCKSGEGSIENLKSKYRYYFKKDLIKDSVSH